MDPRRSERVSEALREELEELIVHELTDPRIQVAGVTEVLISGDARRAHVRLVLLGDAEAHRETLEALEHAQGYLKRQIAQRLDLFRLPDFHFEAAMPAGLGPRAGQLLRRVRRGRPRDTEPATGPEGAENG